MRNITVFVAAVLSLLLTGCQSVHYVTPSGRADLSQISSASMRESFSAEPAAEFPAHIAAVRVQAPGYRSYYTERQGGVYGTGRFSVVTAKDVESDEVLQQIENLPQVGGLVTLSRLLLPERLESDRALREAAARLKADMLLLYTFDTTFHDHDTVKPLSVVTLGLSPTNKVQVNVTASALLIDTRTGFVYGAFESNERRELTTNAWQTREDADAARLDAEAEAFHNLVIEFQKTWPQVVERAGQGA